MSVEEWHNLWVKPKLATITGDAGKNIWLNRVKFVGDALCEENRQLREKLVYYDIMDEQYEKIVDLWHEQDERLSAIRGLITPPYNKLTLDILGVLDDE